MKRPRFIAGAVCPACAAMDRLQVVGDGDTRRRRCVNCGHEDQLSATASPSPRSRLDGARRVDAAEDGVQSVRILGHGAAAGDDAGRAAAGKDADEEDAEKKQPSPGEKDDHG